MPRGEKLHNQSLTERQVRQAWALHLAGGRTAPSIAAEVGAKPYVITDLVKGRSWRHLEGAPTIEDLKAGGVRRGHNRFSR